MYDYLVFLVDFSTTLILSGYFFNIAILSLSVVSYKPLMNCILSTYKNKLSVLNFIVQTSYTKTILEAPLELPSLSVASTLTILDIESPVIARSTA